MTLPDLSQWDGTRVAFHQAMQVLRSTRLLGVSPQPNDLAYGTIPTPSGPTTGPLSFGGALRLDFIRMAIVYEQDGAEVFAVDLAGHNQTSLFDAVFAGFEQAGHTLDPDRQKVTNTDPFDLDAGQARLTAEVMWRMFMALARFKAHLNGYQTPLVLWPHGFDLSTLWFAEGRVEYQDPHLNFGFSPYTPDVGQPYVFFYAWPAPDGLGDRLPAVWTWQPAWRTPGGVIRYDQLLGERDPEGMVTGALLEVYAIASAALRETQG